MAEGALPAADILTPNLFELELLTGLKPRGLQAVRDAAATLLARGPKVVLVTSLDAENPHDEKPAAEGNQDGEMEMLAGAAARKGVAAGRSGAARVDLGGERTVTINRARVRNETGIKKTKETQ